MHGQPWNKIVCSMSMRLWFNDSKLQLLFDPVKCITSRRPRGRPTISHNTPVWVSLDWLVNLWTPAVFTTSHLQKATWAPPAGQKIELTFFRRALEFVLFFVKPTSTCCHISVSLVLFHSLMQSEIRDQRCFVHTGAVLHCELHSVSNVCALMNSNKVWMEMFCFLMQLILVFGCIMYVCGGTQLTACFFKPPPSTPNLVEPKMPYFHLYTSL